MGRFDITEAPMMDVLDSNPVRAAQSLGVLGISPLEEAVYRALLRAPGSTAERLAKTLHLPLASVTAAAAELERKGFATHAPERVPRLLPSPPDIAVESLLLHRQKELQLARLAIADLQRERRNGPEGAPVVEIVDAGPAAQSQPYAQSHHRAVKEVLCLVRPPFLVSAPDKAEDSRAEARKRGVRYRNIVHPDTLALPGWPELLRQDIEAGEEVRLLSDFPFKMIVADRELGLLPLKIDEPQGPMLLLRRSAVLDALCELFDTLWAKAAPLRIGADGTLSAGMPSPYAPRIEALIPLLAAGLNDKAAAERLGISERTLMRRVDELYQALDARSRFQAGWIARGELLP
jgi:sugar-specific transcriptional regulator TrmB